jgi:hypothetical protein
MCVLREKRILIGLLPSERSLTTCLVVAEENILSSTSVSHGVTRVLFPVGKNELFMVVVSFD